MNVRSSLLHIKSQDFALFGYIPRFTPSNSEHVKDSSRTDDVFTIDFVYQGLQPVLPSSSDCRLLCQSFVGIGSHLVSVVGLKCAMVYGRGKLVS